MEHPSASHSPESRAAAAARAHFWRKAVIVACGLASFAFVSSIVKPRDSRAYNGAQPSPRSTHNDDSPKDTPSRFRAGGQPARTPTTPDRKPPLPAAPAPNLNAAPGLEADAEAVRAVFHADQHANHHLDQLAGRGLGSLAGRDYLTFICTTPHDPLVPGAFGATPPLWSALRRGDSHWTARDLSIDDFYRATGLEIQHLHADTWCE